MKKTHSIEKLIWEIVEVEKELYTIKEIQKGIIQLVATNQHLCSKVVEQTMNRLEALSFDMQRRMIEWELLEAKETCLLKNMDVSQKDIW